MVIERSRESSKVGLKQKDGSVAQVSSYYQWNFKDGTNKGGLPQAAIEDQMSTVICFL
jgi:hypothetical protein